MPTAPAHPCANSGCPTLLPRGVTRCPAHAVQQEHARANFTVRRWYRQARWKALRLQVVLEQHYRCANPDGRAECEGTTLEMDVDHIVKHGGDYERFHDRRNLQALCKSCHSAKTARGG